MNFVSYLFCVIGLVIISVATAPMYKDYSTHYKYTGVSRQQTSYTTKPNKKWTCVANWQAETAAAMNDDLEIGLFTVYSDHNTFYRIPFTGRTCGWR